MKSARISELRDSLSEYLALVRKGETVIVYDRDMPIARIEPIASIDDLPDLAQRGIRNGILTPPRNPGSPRITLPPYKPKKPARLLDALLEERRSGR